MEDSITLGIPFVSSLSYTSWLLWISAQYKWHQLWFLPSLVISEVEVQFPCVPDPLNGYQMVLIGCGTYGFLSLRMLNGCLIVYIPIPLLYGFIQLWGSPPVDGDNVVAQLYVTCPGPGNTSFMYSWLAMNLWSLAKIIPYLPYLP